MRGACYLELRVRTAASDLHSGTYGGAVANAAAIVAEIVASLHDADGRVAVAGFYGGVRPPTPDERARLAGLPFDEVRWQADAGGAISAGERGYTALERAWLRPTLEVCGIWGGYDGPGLKAIVPSQAGAKLGGRLVDGQEPDEVYERVTAHVRARLPSGARLETDLLSAARSIRVDPSSRWARAVASATAEVFGAEPSLGCEGGTIPILTSFAERLTPELVLLGLAPPDYHGHAPNERMDLRTFRLAVPAIAGLLDRFGEITP
jgi:acetylornithine deacetylase/succinyl-diaminopimelate desuccinylase-like protein